MNIENIIEKYGTPSYLFDLDILESRLQFLKSKLPYDFVYAIKANSFVLPFMASKVERLEICSSGEIDICAGLKIPSAKKVISGVYKEEEYMENLMNEEVLRYTIESLEQYHLLTHLAHKRKKKIHLLLRLTSGNQFGITKEECETIIQDYDKDYLVIEGIEYFSGTQKHSLKRIEKEINYLQDFINHLKNDLHFSVNELEYGPGLPIYYFQDDDFKEEEFLTELNQLLSKIEPKLYLEIGRSLVASSGFYITKVVDMKTNENGNFVILDGGINQLVYYGQTMAMKIPYMEQIPKRNAIVNYNLCGSLCTINDILVKNVNLQELKINDYIVFHNTGAYSVTEGISLFLSHDLPKVILKNKDKDMLVRDNFKTSKLNFPKIEE